VHHHLPVQDEIVVRERLDGVRDFGKDGGEAVSVTGTEMSSEMLSHYKQPVSTAAAGLEGLRYRRLRALSAVRAQSIRSGLICCGH
jgi:hypothetical protein